MKQNFDMDMNLIFVDWEAGAAKLRIVSRKLLYNCKVSI